MDFRIIFERAFELSHFYYKLIHNYNYMHTKLLYMEDMGTLSCDSLITDIQTVDGKHILILDQTVFYPQGGGQPYDTGTIKNSTIIFKVTEVRFTDGAVHHIGVYESGEFQIGDSVVCVVDEERRVLNTRLHSAGHIIDMGLKKLGIPWVPGKGYHFPNGPYVEYKGLLANFDLETLKGSLENVCNEIVQTNIETHISFDDMTLQNGKPMRTVWYGDFSIPCGGTHVTHLTAVGTIRIRKIKQEKQMIRIAYTVE